MRRKARIEALVEADDGKAETCASRVHELQRSARAGARHRVHLAAGFLRQHAEQQRLGQSCPLVFRPHAIAHVFVVLVGDHQVGAKLGQPLLERDLDRIVQRNEIGQFAALEKRNRARDFRQRGGSRRNDSRFAARVRAIGRRISGIFAEQAAVLAQQMIECGKEPLALAIAQGKALRRRRLQVIERCFGFGSRRRGGLGIGRARRRTRRRVALRIGIQACVQRVDLLDVRRCTWRWLCGRRRLLRGWTGARAESEETLTARTRELKCMLTDLPGNAARYLSARVLPTLVCPSTDSNAGVTPREPSGNAAFD
jgi:hypothetical protein